MMPLSMAKTGMTTNIKKITGKDETKRHLENLGFVPGEDVIVISEISGDLIINIKGSRIAINRSMAMRIMI